MTKATSTQSPNPLQLGQTLYPVNDFTVLAPPQDASQASYYRVEYGDSWSFAQKVYDLESGASIIDAKATYNTAEASQDVFILFNHQGSPALYRVAGPANDYTLYPSLSLSSPLLILGLNPIGGDSAGQLLIAGQDNTGVYVAAFDTATSTAASPVYFSQITGTLRAGGFTRAGLEARAILVTESADASGKSELTAYDLGHQFLLDGTEPETVGQVAVGGVLPSAAVCVDEVAAIAGSADRQLAISYPGPDEAPQLALVGYAHETSGPAIDVVAAIAPDVSFAGWERPVFRVAGADLFNTGIKAGGEQTSTPAADAVVMAYTGTYGSVKGCACFCLFGYGKEDAAGAPTLAQLDTHAIGLADSPFASIDLHIGAGLFGTDLAGGSDPTTRLGISAIGVGADIDQLINGQSAVRGAFVSVDPQERKFDPMPTSGPAEPLYLSDLVTSSAAVDQVLAFPSDTRGLSVVLGPPTLSSSSRECGQILALIQAFPFDDENGKKIQATAPSLTFSSSSSKVDGYNVEASKTWMHTKDIDSSFGIGPLNISNSLSHSYGKNFDNTNDTTTTTALTVDTSVQYHDMMVVYEKTYDVWTYPVYRKLGDPNPSGSVAVVFPQSAIAIQTFQPTDVVDYGYAPRSEPGRLLTYLDLPLLGYDKSEPDKQILLFDLVQLTVGTDSTSSKVTYDKEREVSSTLGKSYSVSNSASTGANFDLSSMLFSFLPLSFGLDIKEGTEYDSKDATTTSLSRTDEFTIEMDYGTVTDDKYQFQVTPYIYQHDKTHCLMVAYQVNLDTEGGYKEVFSDPELIMMALFTKTSDPLYASFTRSLTFAKASAGGVDMRAEIFNNSLVDITPADGFVCTFYLGLPQVDKSGALAPPTETLGQVAVDTMPGKARTTLTLNTDRLPQKPAKGSDQCVTIALGKKSPESAQNIYWGVYPLTDSAAVFNGLPATP